MLFTHFTTIPHFPLVESIYRFDGLTRLAYKPHPVFTRVSRSTAVNAQPFAHGSSGKKTPLAIRIISVCVHPSSPLSILGPWMLSTKRAFSPSVIGAPLGSLVDSARWIQVQLNYPLTLSASPIQIYISLKSIHKFDGS